MVQDKEHLFLIMDYLPGGTLLNLFTQRTFARNDAFVKHMFLQLIDAVHYCHERGVYHRDLKPENILLNRDRTKLFVTDFGLSTETRYSKCFNTGTRQYMSPECINRNVDSYSCKRNDIWAIGVILFNMITGRNPWSSASFDDQHFQHYLCNPLYFGTRFPISKAATYLLRRMLCPDPDDCIDLEEVYSLVKEVDTFFMTDAEIARAPKTCQFVAKYLRPQSVGPAQEAKPSPVIERSTTSGDSSGSESNFEPASKVADKVGSVGAARERGQKATAAQVAPRPSANTGSTESSSSQPDTLVTTSNPNSSGGLRSFLRHSRPRGNDAKTTAASGPPELSSRRVTLSRLAGQFRRAFGAA